MRQTDLPYIEEECDRLEYQCSMIYDEYPDRLQLQMMCKRICENVKKHEKFWMECEYPEISSHSEREFEENSAVKDIRKNPGTGTTAWSDAAGLAAKSGGSHALSGIVKTKTGGQETGTENLLMKKCML